jgi:hypothetical protein
MYPPTPTPTLVAMVEKTAEMMATVLVVKAASPASSCDLARHRSDAVSLSEAVSAQQLSRTEKANVALPVSGLALRKAASGSV